VATLTESSELFIKGIDRIINDDASNVIAEIQIEEIVEDLSRSSLIQITRQVSSSYPNRWKQNILYSCYGFISHRCLPSPVEDEDAFVVEGHVGPTHRKITRT
jgi:hypothetical protein